MPVEVGKLTWANVDLDNRDEMQEFARQERERAGERIRAEVKRLQAMGIIDSSGRRIRQDLPEDMQEHFQTDFGG